MAALTAAKIASLRLKLDDRVEPYLLQDSDIQDIWDEAGAETVQFMLDALDIILALVAKQVDYTQNATSERKGQLMANYEKLRAIWQKKRDAAEDDAEELRMKQNQVRVVGVRVMPKAGKDRP